MSLSFHRIAAKAIYIDFADPWPVAAAKKAKQNRYDIEKNAYIVGACYVDRAPSEKFKSNLEEICTAYLVSNRRCYYEPNTRITSCFRFYSYRCNFCSSNRSSSSNGYCGLPTVDLAESGRASKTRLVGCTVDQSCRRKTLQASWENLCDVLGDGKHC